MAAWVALRSARLGRLSAGCSVRRHPTARAAASRNRREDRQWFFEDRSNDRMWLNSVKAHDRTLALRDLANDRHYAERMTAGQRAFEEEWHQRRRGEYTADEAASIRATARSMRLTGSLRWIGRTRSIPHGEGSITRCWGLAGAGCARGSGKPPARHRFSEAS